MGIGGKVAKQMAPRVQKIAPGLTTSVIHEALAKAIDGVGPLAGAAAAAEKQLAEKPGDIDHAIHEVIEFNVRLAGTQGFLTNLGGLVTAAVTIPANIAGLAMIQIRMVAGIAHLRGYDLSDQRVRNAILACILGEDGVAEALKKKRLPARPIAIATAATADPELNRAMAAEVTSVLMTRVAGKRLATTVGRRVPVVGGLVGAGADGYATWKIGRYADREMLPR
ncbi:MAG TPA: EcsC family protein [Nocardioidaceae bacterium]|nr:EcsC family protein [Nocardioidaceae bacterium]